MATRATAVRGRPRPWAKSLGRRPAPTSARSCSACTLACRTWLVESSKVDSATYAAAPRAGDVSTNLRFRLPDELRGQPALWLRQRDQAAEHGQAAAPCADDCPAHFAFLCLTCTRPASPLAKATRPSRRTRANRRAQRRRSPRFDYIRPSDASLASQPFGYGNTTSN